MRVVRTTLIIKIMSKKYKKQIKIEVIVEAASEKEKALIDGIRAAISLIREGTNGVGCGSSGVYEYKIISKRVV